MSSEQTGARFAGAGPVRFLLGDSAQECALYVHELRFVDTAELQRCFAELMKHASVEDCTVEPEALRIRFCSPPRRAAQILERVYLFGGLTWCTRHRIRERS